jgi:FKBP-type peptidyl-prolyl cis-trans isomerase
MMSFRKSLFLTFATVLTLSQCGEDPYATFRVDFSTVPAAFDTTQAQATYREDGLIVYTFNPGSGPNAITELDAVDLFYTLRLAKNGQIVESTYANGNTRASQFRMNTVVRGFREGLHGKRDGAKVTLIIPPLLAYYGSSSPFREDTLRFDIEVSRVLD